MGKYDELIGSVKMEVSVTEVLDEQAASKVDKQIKEHKKKLEEPIKPKLDLSETERGLKRLENQVKSLAKEEERLAREASKAAAGGDLKEMEKAAVAHKEVEDQLKRVRKEQQGVVSDLRAYQREAKAARGASRKLSAEEKKAAELIEAAKTPRPKKPKAKASDSGDVAAAKEEVKANEKLVESVENVSKAKRKAKASKPKTTDTDVVKEEVKANEGLVDAIENVDKVKRKSRAAKPKTSEVETVKEEAQANEQLADAHKEIEQKPQKSLHEKQQEKLLKHQEKMEAAMKRLDELSQDPYEIKDEKLLNDIYEERLSILEKIGEEELRNYNESAYFEALRTNEDYDTRLVSLRETRDDKIYDQLDEQYAYDNQIIHSSAELESLLENRKNLMKDIYFTEEESYKTEQKYNKEIEQRIALMKELEPLVQSGAISKETLEDMVFERGNIDERREMLSGVWQNLFNLDDGDLDEAQMLLDQYEKILVTTASGKKLELGPEMSEADYKAFMKADAEKVKSVEFVRKAIEKQETANDELIDSDRTVIQTSETAADAMREEAKAVVAATEASQEYIKAQERLLEVQRNLKSGTEAGGFSRGGVYSGREGRLTLASRIASELEKFDLSDEEIGKIIDSTYEQFSKVKNLIVDKGTWDKHIKGRLEMSKFGALFNEKYDVSIFKSLRPLQEFQELEPKIIDGLLSAADAISIVDDLVAKNNLSTVLGEDVPSATEKLTESNSKAITSYEELCEKLQEYIEVKKKVVALLGAGEDISQYKPQLNELETNLTRGISDSLDLSSATMMLQAFPASIDARALTANMSRFLGIEMPKQQQEKKSIGQSLLELEQITGKSLIGVLNDYDNLDDGIKEKVNSILKSIGLMNDQLELVFSRDQGGNAEAIIGKDFVILQKSIEKNDEYASKLIDKLKEAKSLGIDVAPVMERAFSGLSENTLTSEDFRPGYIINDYFTPGYEVQQRATGDQLHINQRAKGMNDLNVALKENQTLLEVSDEHLKKFINDYIKLDSIGVDIDPTSGNFLYDVEKGFSFIDLSLKRADKQAKSVRDVFSDIVSSFTTNANHSLFENDESYISSLGQVAAKVSEAFQNMGLASREELDRWAKETFSGGYENIYPQYLQHTGATKWIDELRVKADALDEEFKNSQYYKDFFAAIENGSITAADGMRKLEEAFNAFSDAKVGIIAESTIEEIPHVLSSEQLVNAFDAVDLGAYFKSLNITSEGVIQTLKELYVQLLQLSRAEDSGIDVGDRVNDTWNEIINTIMRFGSVTYDAAQEYKEFWEAMQNSKGEPIKLTFNSGQVAEFGDDWKATRKRFGRYLIPLSSGKGIGVDQIWDELSKFGLFKPEDANNEQSQLKAVLRELGKAMDLKNNGWKISSAISDDYGIHTDLGNHVTEMMAAALRTEEAVEKEETALKGLEGQAEKTANAKKKVTKANKELGDAAVDSKGKLEGETEAAEELAEKAKWTTPRDESLKRDDDADAKLSGIGLNLPTQFVGENGSSVVEMFAKIKGEIEEATGSPVKIDFVSEVKEHGKLEAVGATLEYINKESGVTVKQFYEIASGEGDVIKATQTAEKATLRATKAQKEFNAQLQQQLAYQQIDTFRKEMGQFAVDLSAVQNAANNITDKNSLDEFNVQLKIARETLKGMKAQMKSQNTLDPIVAAEKRLKSLDSELESLKNKFVFKAGSGVDTKWIDDQIASIKSLRKDFDNETDSSKKTGYYKQIIAEIDKAEDGMTNLNELVRLQNKLFKDRRTLSKMDSDTESYKVLEKSVMLQSQELSNLIRNSQHKETIMKRAIQFENELAAATQDRVNKQEQAFDKRYAGATVISEASWDKNRYADSKEAMKAFANSISNGEIQIKGFNKAGTEMYITLRNVEGSLDEVTVALDKNSGKMKAFKTGTNGIVEALKSVGKSGLSMAKQAIGMYVGIHDFIRYFQQGIEHVREIDKSLTELKKVTDETDESYTKFLKHLSQTAGTIGTTVSDLTTSAADWARLGYTMEQAGELAKNTSILMNVSEFDSITTATDTLISALQAYKNEGADVADLSMEIINKYNEIGNSYAISTSDLAESLTRSSATLVAAGNDLSQSIALTTAANATIQDPNSVGNALKVVSMRLRGTTAKVLEDMGEDTEGLVESTSKLQEKIYALTAVNGGKGINILGDNGDYKSTYQILLEISNVFDKISDTNQAALLELLAGKQRGSVVAAILQNGEMLENVYKSAEGAENSAMKELNTYLDSIQGHIDVLNNSWQTMWNNALNGDLLKFFVDLANVLVKVVDKVGLLQVVFGALSGVLAFKTFDKEKGVFGLFEALNKLPVFEKLIGSITAKFGLGTTATALFGSALTGLVGVGIGLAIPVIMKIADALITTSAEIEEAAMTAQEAINTINGELKNAESVVSDSAQRFAELAQGVDMLNGKNLSLTTDEYEEFLDLSNQLADVFPTLSRNYDENGNAIVQLSGDTDTMVASLKNLLDVQRQVANQQIAAELPDVYAGAYAKSKEYTKQIKASATSRDELLKKIEHINSVMSDGFVNWTDANIIDIDDKEILELYEEASKIAGYSFYDNYNQIIKFGKSTEDMQAGIRSVFADLAKQYNTELNAFNNTIASSTNKNNANWSNVLSSIFAWLTTDASYQALNDEMQSVIQTMINNIDFDSLEDVNTWDKMQEYIQDNIISKIEGSSPTIQKAFSELMRIRPEYYSGTDDFITAIRDKANAIASIENSPFSVEEILDTTGYQGIIEQYETTANDIIRVLDDNLNGSELQKVKDNVFDLSPDEMIKALNIVKNYGIDTWDELKEALDRKTFDIVIDYDVETEGLEKLQSALEETVSATGLSAESVGSIKARYQDLDSYDPAKLFEETANGIHLNIQAARELEAEYEKLNKEALDNKLEGLTEQYNDLTAEIQDTSDAVKRADLYAQRNNILDQIKDTATLISRYDGLTSSYNKWQKAQAGPEERDMYEGIIAGKKEVDEEISRGWMDDSTREYLELMSGQDLSTANFEKLLEVYKSLKNTIGSSGYSIYDFFTKDDDDNATADGVYNFFDTVKSAFDETVAWVDSNGKYHLDFANAIFGDETGDAAIAKALGISEELVQIILRAASEAGFQVNLESAMTQFADLKDEATLANDTLKQLGATEYTFNINSTSIADVNYQIEEAKKTFNQFVNEEDGTIDLSVPGAKEAQTLLATLIYQKQTLDDSIILRVDTTNAKDGVETVVKKLQDFKSAWNEYELKINIGEDATDAETKLDSVVTELQKESPEILSALGIDVEQSHFNILQAIDAITKDQLLDLDLDPSLIAGYTAEGTVIWENNLKEVTDWMAETHVVEGTVKWKSDASSIPTYFSAYGGIYGNGLYVNGTAHAKGNWGAPRTETALVGELGAEMRVRDGRWELIGEHGAEFSDVKKGDIIFNHKQTEELLSNGHITGRGKAYAEGGFLGWLKGLKTPNLDVPVVDTFKKLFGSSTKQEKKKEEVKTTKSTTIVTQNTTTNVTPVVVGAAQVGANAITPAQPTTPVEQENSGSSASGGSRNDMDAAQQAGGAQTGKDKDKDDSKQLIDFIEMKLENIEATISKTSTELTTYADNASKQSIKDKKDAYDVLVQAEQDKAKTYYDAKDYYGKKAEDLLKKVDKDYRDKAKNGAIAIKDFVGENQTKQAEAIQEYRDMLAKANDAEAGYYEAIAQQSAYRVEHIEDIASDYENLVNLVGSKSDLLEAEMSLMEEFGAIQSAENYQTLIDNSLEQLGYLQEEKRTLEAELTEAVNNGDIIVGTDEWYEAKSIIADVDQEIVQCKTDIVSFANEMENLRWDALDRLMTRLESIDSQLSHLFDRFTDGDVVDEAGNWTSKGIAALGVSFQKMESAKAQAQKYASEIEQLDADFAAGLYAGREEVYYEKREELTEKQWDAIEALEAEKDAIIDLNKERVEAIKKGIDEEIDAYKELIAAKKEALDADKDSRDFERSVQDKQKEIDKIDRKIAALAGDNSASAAAQRKKLQEEKAELQADLDDLYYDRSIENQKDAFDQSAEDFEKSKEEEKETLDNSLKDEEKVISDSLNIVKSNTATVLSEIQGISSQYGVSIAAEITKPWTEGQSAISNFSQSFTTFAEEFDVSTFTEELQKIVKKYEDIESAAREAAEVAFGMIGGDPSGIGNTGSNPPKNDPPKTDPPTTQEPAKEPEYDTYTIKKGDNLWNLAKKEYGSGAKYKDIYEANKDVIKDPNKVYVGQTIKIPKYAKGTMGVKDDEFAWINEIGEELVLHADGSGNLAYMTKGSTVVPSDLTQKLIDLAIDPTQTLENSRPVISAPQQITNNEINVNMEFGEVVHIDTVTNDTIPDLTKAIEKQMDKYMKGLNNQIRKYSR